MPLSQKAGRRSCTRSQVATPLEMLLVGQIARSDEKLTSKTFYNCSLSLPSFNVFLSLSFASTCVPAIFSFLHTLSSFVPSFLPTFPLSFCKYCNLACSFLCFPRIFGYRAIFLLFFLTLFYLFLLVFFLSGITLFLYPIVRNFGIYCVIEISKAKLKMQVNVTWNLVRDTRC